jgi:hypothetical protein
MKKLLIVGGAVAGAVFAAKRARQAAGEVDFGQIIERMPENAPPKWMFRNITEIRENTERAVQLLESERASAGNRST